jgi:hypothetical protein
MIDSIRVSGMPSIGATGTPKHPGIYRIFLLKVFRKEVFNMVQKLAGRADKKRHAFALGRFDSHMKSMGLGEFLACVPEFTPRLFYELIL